MLQEPSGSFLHGGDSELLIHGDVAEELDELESARRTDMKLDDMEAGSAAHRVAMLEEEMDDLRAQAQAYEEQLQLQRQVQAMLEVGPEPRRPPRS